MGRKRLLLGAGYVAAVGLIAGGAWMFGVRHEGGPLKGAVNATMCIAAQGSTDFSHTVGFYRNTAGRDARIDSVTLLDSDGLLLADAVVVQQTAGPTLAAREWPPAGSSQLVWSGRQQAVGAKVPPADDPDGPDAKRWDLVLHLRPADDRALARMGGVRVEYSVGPRRYKLTEEYRFAVVRTGQCTQGDIARPGVTDEQRIGGS